MKQEILVPEVGESITEGVLVAWLVEEGDRVEAETPLFELETDKITLEVPSPVAGVLHREVEAGSTVQVGQRVGVIDTAAASPAASAPRAEAVAVPESAASPSRAEAAVVPAGPESAASPSRAEAAVVSARRESAASPSRSSNPTARGWPGFGPSAPTAVLAAAPGAAPIPPLRPLDIEALSPAVRRLVLEHQLDPAEIPATGPGGRLTKGDVLAYLAQRAGEPRADAPIPGPEASAAPTAAPDAEHSGAPHRRQTRAKMSPLRSRIAERLVQAKREAAMLTTFNEVDMSRIMALRKSLQEPFEKQHGRRLGFMSFFVKAVVDALGRVPALNAYIEGDEIVTNHYYDIGVAVGTERGLMVPVVRDCDRLGFAEIEAAIADLARRVREKKIGLDELQGGCFTISNGGIYGSLLSTPILNPPQSGILGMHAIKKRPVVVGDEIVIRPMMYLALSYDHRVVDGREAVTFLKRVVECLEAPERMLLDV